MTCNEIRELLPDLASGLSAETPEVSRHIGSCHSCSTQLHELQQTMALLDEWQAPEPSPYFDTRLQARLRDEMARPAIVGWRWLLRPALGMALAALVLAGAIAVGFRPYFVQTEAISTTPPEITAPVLPGSAVGDLQALERNNDLYADFDVLDELQVQSDVTANP